MTETTTPDAVTDAEAPILVDDDQSTQLPAEQPDEAVDTTDEPLQPTDPTKEDPDSGIDTDPDKSAEEDLSDWATKKGIDLSTQEGQAKALKSWREAEKAMHRKGQEASELSKQLTEQPVDVETDNPLVQQLATEVVTMKRAQNVSSFKESVNLTPEQETVMADYLLKDAQASETAGRASKTQLVNAGLLTLQEVYNLSGAANPDPDTLKQQGGQEALQKLANKQRATAVRGAATNPDVSTDKEDPFLAGFNKD